jgi:hypothetical protein
MKFLFRDEIKKIIEEAPEGSDPKAIIAGLIKKGFVLEGIGDFKNTLKGEPGAPGKDGKDYVLTQADKEEIASYIKVPVVEKVVEKTEVVREIPVVTETIKEDTGAIEKVKEELEKEIAEIREAVNRKPTVLIDRSPVGGFIETQIKAGTNVGVTKDASGSWVISTEGSTGFQDFTIGRTGTQITSVTLPDKTYTIGYSGTKVSTIFDGTETMTLNYTGSDITSGTVA